MKLPYFLYILLMLIISCKDDKGAERAICSVGNTVKIPTDAVRRFYFKDSTWWIYEDSVTHILDSMWVVGSTHESSNNIAGHKLYKRCYELFDYEIKNIQEQRILVSLEPNGVNEEGEYSNEFFRVEFNILPKLGNPSYYNFILKGDIYENPGANGDTLIFINNLNVKNRNYRDVIHLSNLQSTTNVYTDVWFADSIGLIKYQLSNGSKWELLRYKLYK